MSSVRTLLIDMVRESPTGTTISAEVDMFVRKHATRCVQIVSAVMLTLMSFEPARADQNTVLAATDAAIADPDNDVVFKAYLATLPKVTNPLAPGTDFYLVEGDIPMTERQVRTHLRSASAGVVSTVTDNPELLVNTVAGKPTYWATLASRTLRYSIARASFPDQAKFDTVVRDMAVATNTWSAACPRCKLTFSHRAEFDNQQDINLFISQLRSDAIRFVVFYSDAPENQFIARAFFPSSPAEQRAVILDQSYFNLNGTRFTGPGVLRHELGHTLGYRHEHTRGIIAGCYYEDNKWLPLTPYDGRSVMHYPCGPAAARGDLVLTPLDVVGHRRLYSRVK
jgi:hypothetical protein